MMAATSLVTAGEAKRELPGILAGPLPVMKDARVTLLLDKDEYLLGENVLLHYCLANTGEKPFKINMGGDYRGVWRHLRFTVAAMGEDGKPVPDPDPSTLCMGGLVWSRELKPGETVFKSLPLIRYCRFEKPGVYTVRASHDLGWKGTRETPVGEVKIKLVMPTTEQARGVVEEMYRLPEDPNVTAGEKGRRYADFSALRHPVYLRLLLERAKEGCTRALRGIQYIPTPEATQALVELLGHNDPEFVVKVARSLRMRLPDPRPQREPRPASHFDATRRWLVPASWQERFAPATRAHARKLLTRKDLESVACGAFVIRSIGKADDLPALIRALDWLVVQLTEAETQRQMLTRERDICDALRHAARKLVRAGSRVPPAPRSPGETVVFLTALAARDDFRPKGWEAQCREFLRHDRVYVRRVALECLPRPWPAACRRLLPTLLADPDVEVLVRAVCAAQRAKAPELHRPVLKVVASAKDEWLLRTAHNAAMDLGARVESLDVLASRLDEAEIGRYALRYLVNSVVETPGVSGSRKLEPGTARALKTRWTEFLQEHREALEAGRRFKLGGPELTPDILPSGYQFRLKDGKTWP